MTLIVLEDSEIKRLVPPTGDRHLGSVDINDAKALPSSKQLWAGAHVQVSGETTVEAGKAASLMAAASMRSTISCWLAFFGATRFCCR